MLPSSFFNTRNPRARRTSATGYKVAIIGAGGKIGSQVLRNIWSQPDKYTNIATLVGINRTPEINYGMYLDFGPAYAAELFDTRRHSIETVLTSSPEDLAGMDAIFITAGLWPDANARAHMAQYDNTGRLVQSYVNYPLMLKLCRDIKQYAPDAIVYVVTNQVDMMSAVVRRELPEHTVLGIGGCIDTMRFKFVLAILLHRAGVLDNANPGRIEVQIAGYHNNDMVLLQDSLKIDGERPENMPNDILLVLLMKQALDITKRYGKTVSQLQTHPEHKDIDAGSSIEPARVITDIIEHLCNNTTLTGAFNVVLDDATAVHYGVRPHDALSVPVAIRGKHVTPITDFEIHPAEKALLEIAQINMLRDIDNLLLHAPVPETLPTIDNTRGFVVQI